MATFTEILHRIDQGDAQAAADLLPVVYEELRRLAAEQLKEESPGQTLQATALVHEAYLRLVDVPEPQGWANRRHFYGAAAEAMRRILIERARRRRRHKHGGDLRRIALDPDAIPESPLDELIEILDEALSKFRSVDPVGYELVRLRYFAGLTLREAADVLDIPPRSADRLWAYAKAWLLRELRRDPGDES